MAVNTVNDEENLNSQSSQLDVEDLQKLTKETSACTACSSSMAGCEVHVSFAASSQTHSVQPVMQNCDFSNCTINFNSQITFVELSFHVFYTEFLKTQMVRFCNF